MGLAQGAAAATEDFQYLLISLKNVNNQSPRIDIIIGILLLMFTVFAGAVILGMPYTEVRNPLEGFMRRLKGRRGDGYVLMKDD